MKTLSLVERNLRRQRKIEEWEHRVALLHDKYPRLGEISQLLARMAREQILVEMGQGKMGMGREELSKAQESLLSEKQGIYQKYNLPSNLEQVWWDCRVCQDTGFSGIGIKCTCLLQEETRKHRINSGLSPEQEGQNFTNFSLDWYVEKERHKNNLDACLEFAKGVSSRQPVENLLICGAVGTGKTHLCSAIANYVLQAGVRIIYLKISHLLDLIRDYKFNLDKSSPKEQNRNLDNLIKVDLLIIDDLGTEGLTDFVKEQLLLLLDERNNYHLPWVISTNLTPNELDEKYELRLVDRIIGTSKILKFTGESIRSRRKLSGDKSGR